MRPFARFIVCVRSLGLSCVSVCSVYRVCPFARFIVCVCSLGLSCVSVRSVYRVCSQLIVSFPHKSSVKVHVALNKKYTTN